MKSNYKKLGNYIQLVDERNKNLEISNVLGINIQKNFMPSVANTSESDLSKYKVIKKGQFAYSAMQVGRDETVRVVLYTSDIPAIISPAYLVFEVIDLSIVLPEYLMMWFQRPESDRFGWFISDGSVRSSLEWERFCEIELPIPDDIEVQKSVVEAYNGLLKNQSNFENSLNDLQLVCDSFMENITRKKDLKTLGEYIQQCDERNSDLLVPNLLGLSINKKFFPSNTNQTDLDVRGCKIVHQGQFSFVTVTSRNGEKISVGLLDGESGIVSSTYIVFKILDEKKLLPEFLLLWFKRSDFDRYARFHSWGSARETFNWEDMCAVKIPIPDIEVQRSIVAIHHALESRKRINEGLKNMITPLCPILMSGVVNNLDIN
jgi:type I restriction enzyme, S subunit